MYLLQSGSQEITFSPQSKLLHSQISRKQVVNAVPYFFRTDSPGSHFAKRYRNTCKYVLASSPNQNNSRWWKGFFDREKLFIKACSDRTRGNSFKLKDNRFSLNIKISDIYIIFNTIRVVRQCNRLPREVADASPLKCARSGWVGLLSNLN